MSENETLDTFQNASEHVRGLTGLDQSTMLTLYGLYKQATVGRCNTEKPAFWDFVGKSKWESWKKLDDMESCDARLKYVELVRKLDPSWDESASEKKLHKPKAQGSGITVSKLYCEDEDIMRDADKTVFDWCKEGNINEVAKFASTEKCQINALDENGMSLLHWSCDRGHNEIVDFLISQKADVNQRDSELQTPLHYAAVCENEDIVRKLLTARADPELKDNTGLTPFQSTTSNSIKNIISPQHNSLP